MSARPVESASTAITFVQRQQRRQQGAEEGGRARRLSAAARAAPAPRHEAEAGAESRAATRAGTAVVARCLLARRRQGLGAKGERANHLRGDADVVAGGALPVLPLCGALPNRNLQAAPGGADGMAAQRMSAPSTAGSATLLLPARNGTARLASAQGHAAQRCARAGRVMPPSGPRQHGIAATRRRSGARRRGGAARRGGPHLAQESIVDVDDAVPGDGGRVDGQPHEGAALVCAGRGEAGRGTRGGQEGCSVAVSGRRGVGKLGAGFLKRAPLRPGATGCCACKRKATLHASSPWTQAGHAPSVRLSGS